MKSVLTKRAVKQVWLGYAIAGCTSITAGVFVVLATGIKRGPVQYTTFGLVMMLYGFILINHATLVRGQSEIKKSITNLKEKIDELKEKK